MKRKEENLPWSIGPDLSHFSSVSGRATRQLHPNIDLSAHSDPTHWQTWHNHVLESYKSKTIPLLPRYRLKGEGKIGYSSGNLYKQINNSF